MPQVPPIFWINLEKDNERRLAIESALCAQRIHHTRIEAIWDADGRKGCCLSHIRAIHTAWHSGAERALICEDDVDFSGTPDWSQRLIDILGSSTVMYGDWEILQLHWIDPKLMGELAVSPIQQNILMRGYLMSGAAYCINRKGMQRFLEIFTDKWLTSTDYRVMATFDHPACTGEELIYRYVRTYCSLFPIVNVWETGLTNVGRDPNQWIHNFTNMHLINALFARSNELKYAITPGTPIYELGYDIHWHADAGDAREEMHKILNN